MARTENRIVIVLDIGNGIVRINVLDDTGAGLAGARVQAIEVGKKTVLKDQLTDLDGTTEFVIRADLEVYFVATAEGYLPYYTNRIPVDAGVAKEKTIRMVKTIDALKVDFLGLFVGDSQAVGTLAPGQLYTAKMLLLVPNRVNESGIHFRIGKTENNITHIIEEDSLFIKEVRAGTNNILKGISYTPPLGYATDVRRLTSGDAKWADIVWKDANTGVYEAEADIMVRDNAVLGEQLMLWYRGWGKTDGYDRYPIDNELKRLESTQNKQALYANANLVQYSIGPVNLCKAFFFNRFFISYDFKSLCITFVLIIAHYYTVITVCL